MSLKMSLSKCCELDPVMQFERLVAQNSLLSEKCI